MCNRLFAFEAPDQERLVAAVESMTGPEVPFWLSIPDNLAAPDALLLAPPGLVERAAAAPGTASLSIPDPLTPDTGIARRRYLCHVLGTVVREVPTSRQGRSAEQSGRLPTRPERSAIV